MANIKVTERELATVLFALRVYQGLLERPGPAYVKGAMHFQEEKPLTAAEVDRLCENLNCNHSQLSKA
jgi:hypothetical protein